MTASLKPNHPSHCLDNGVVVLVAENPAADINRIFTEPVVVGSFLSRLVCDCILSADPHKGNTNCPL